MTTAEFLLARKLSGGGSGGDITIKSLNVTANGTYTEEGVAYSPVNVNVPTPTNAYLLNDIPSGDISTFNADALPMPSLKVSVEAKQDLHGYDHPWVGGAGKNKLPNPTAETKTVGNLTVSIDSLGTITVSGSTSTTTTILFDLPSDFVIPVSVNTGGSGCLYLFNASVNNNIVLMLYNNDNLVDTCVCNEVNRKNSSYSAMGGMTINKIGIRVLDTTTISGSFKLSPMFTNDGTTDATFAPYSNICPISGWDEAKVSDVGKNLCPLPSIQGLWMLENGTYSNRTTWCCTEKFSIKPNTTYVVSATRETRNVGCVFWDANGEYIGYVNNTVYGEVSLTFTTPTNCRTIAICIADKVNGEGIAPSDVTDLQLEYGSTASEYVPYNPDSYTTTISLNGTRYGCELDVVNGGATDNFIIETFDGSNDEVWDEDASHCYSVKLNEALQAWKSDVECVSNEFEYNGTVSGASYMQHAGLYLWYNSSIVQEPTMRYAMIRNNNMSLSELKAYLAEHPLQVCYELATPTTFETQPTPITSLEGQNNLSVDCGEVIEGTAFIKA